MMRARLYGVVVVLILLSGALSAQGKSRLGLATEYPGDKGITDHDAVIFADGFESGDISAWNGGNRREKEHPVIVISDPHNVHTGRYAARANYIKGESQAGGISHAFLPGYDEIYVRWYVKFSRNFVVENDLHHQRIQGRRSRGERKWVSAGSRPKGDDAFSAGVDAYTRWKRHPGAGYFHFYSYFPTMKAHGDGRYWGNTDGPEEPIMIKPDTWYCVEHRCKVNTITPEGKVGENGEEELWVNGTRQILVKGRVWRTSDILMCNAVSMGFWMTKPPEQDQQMWVDDVVVARSYIGPMVPTESAGEAQ